MKWLQTKYIAIAGCLVFALFLGAGVFAASNLVLNSGNRVELGAGSQRVTICDDNVFIDPPQLSFDAAQQKYLVSTISISQVSQSSPSGCGNYIMELALGYTNGYEITSWSIPSSSVDSTFYFGGTTSGTQMAKTILTPFDPNMLQNIALQMYPGLTCAEGGPCNLGDIGPGGGPVFYVAASSFTEPVSGKKYKYIEAAPSYWVSGVIDPRSTICQPNSISQDLSESIGYAKSNTDVFMADGNCSTNTSNKSLPSGLSQAAGLVRSYGSDWNLPTFNELIEMCKLARFGATVAPTKTNCNDSGGSAPTGWLTVSYGSSSKKAGAGWASSVDFNLGGVNNTSSVQSSNFGIRPIRYIG